MLRMKSGKKWWFSCFFLRISASGRHFCPRKDDPSRSPFIYLIRGICHPLQPRAHFLLAIAETGRAGTERSPASCPHPPDRPPARNLFGVPAGPEVSRKAHPQARCDLERVRPERIAIV